MYLLKGFKVALVAKNLSAMQATWVQPLGWEDSLEEGMATHSSILMTGESPWIEEPGGLQPMELQRVGHDWETKHTTQQYVHSILMYLLKVVIGDMKHVIDTLHNHREYNHSML